MYWVQRANDALTRALMVVAALCAFAMAFYILVDVITRNLGAPIEGTTETIRNAIVIMVFLQIAYCIRVRGMIRTTIFSQMLGPSSKKYVSSVGYLFGVAFFVFVVVGSLEPAIDAWKNGYYEGEGSLHVPVWPMRFSIVFGSALAAVNYALLIVEELFSLNRGELTDPRRSLAAK